MNGKRNFFLRIQTWCFYRKQNLEDCKEKVEREMKRARRRLLVPTIKWAIGRCMWLTCRFQSSDATSANQGNGRGLVMCLVGRSFRLFKNGESHPPSMCWWGRLRQWNTVRTRVGVRANAEFQMRTKTKQCVNSDDTPIEIFPSLVCFCNVARSSTR